eukprot:707365_1
MCTSELTSRQWIIFIMYCWGFFALGIFTSAPGPILPTLETQVHVPLAIISYIFSARAIGFVLGSMISGYVMDRYQKHLISSKNVAAITNAGVPYVHDVYSLSVLVTINGICFGNINTFGNVLLLTLFDTEISHDIDFDLIYATDFGLNVNTKFINSKQNERQELIEDEPSSYGSLSRNDLAEATSIRRAREEEKVGPYMQFLQAIYAVGGFLAPIIIQFSFQISGGYAYAFWFFTAMYIPPGVVLLFYPEPVRMSVITDRLKEIENVNRKKRSTCSVASQATELSEMEMDPVAKLKRGNKQFWSIWLCLGFATFLLWYVGAQVGYGMYVTTYAIDYLNASAADGRRLASANWAGLFVGRFVAVPLSHHMTALNMVRLDLLGIILGCIILFFSARWQYVVWISSVVVGFCMASVWPSMFVWAEKLIPVTGIFASIMVGGGSLGEFIIPALQGNIMAAFGPQYFNHVMLAMSIFLLANLLINQVIANRLAKFI